MKLRMLVRVNTIEDTMRATFEENDDDNHDDNGFSDDGDGDGDGGDGEYGGDLHCSRVHHVPKHFTHPRCHRLQKSA